MSAALLSGSVSLLYDGWFRHGVGAERSEDGMRVPYPGVAESVFLLLSELVCVQYIER